MTVLQYRRSTNGDSVGYKRRNLTDSATYAYPWSCRSWKNAAHNTADVLDLKCRMVLVQRQHTSMLFVSLTFVWSVLAFKYPRPVGKLALLKIIQNLLFLATELKRGAKICFV